MHKETSARVSTIAARVLAMEPRLEAVGFGASNVQYNELLTDAKSLAGSCMSQDETPGSGSSRNGPMNFGEALELLQRGKRVARTGWNGKGMFAYLVPAASYPVQTGAAKEHFGEGSMVPYRAYLALKTADDDVATWAPSCSDVLANDWVRYGE